MLGSLFSSTTTSSSSSSHEEDLDPRTFQILPHSPPSHGGSGGGGFIKFNNPPGLLHMRQLLMKCAELVCSTQSDSSAARRLLSLLSSTTSPLADSSTERLVHHFAAALSFRLRLSHNASASSSSCASAAGSEFDETLMQSSYLSLNQITPFLRFSHLTANQAILESVQGHRAIHVFDLEISYGVQWPPFMQAIAALCPPPSLRITGAGTNLSLLRRTGDRLLKFARSLGLIFRFQPLLLPSFAAASVDLIIPAPEAEEQAGEDGEALAVNCAFYLHKLLAEYDDEDDTAVRLFLRRIKDMKPRVVTMAEHEGDHSHPHFLPRFAEALDRYAAIFDSLEATVPPSNQERLAVERVWLRGEIMEMVGKGKLRHRRHGAWEVMMRELGFRNVPLSAFALSQAKLLLRLHYPSEGYQLHFLDDSFFLLGWQSHALFSVSSWR